MYAVTFDKTRYHLQNDMAAWCRETIGDGGWTYDHPELWEGKVWVMFGGMFGNITYAFKEESHLALFLLRWE